jgi:hypothetical protein
MFGYSPVILSNKFQIDLDLVNSIIANAKKSYELEKSEDKFDPEELYSIFKNTDANHTHLQFRFRKRRSDVINLLDSRFGSEMESIIKKKRDFARNCDAFLKYSISEMEIDVLKSNPRYVEWEHLIQKRDNSTCRMCGHSHISGKIKTTIYHIDEFLYFPERRLDVDNGITLCRYCREEMEPNWINAKTGLKQIIKSLEATKNV